MKGSAALMAYLRALPLPVCLLQPAATALLLRQAPRRKFRKQAVRIDQVIAKLQRRQPPFDS
jgi:hypothetical protein